MPVTVTLGGKDYEIDERPSRQQRPWKERLRSDLGPFVDQLLRLYNASQESSKDVGPLITQQVIPFLGEVDDAVEKVFDLVVDYSPKLVADRERLEATALDSEILQAFVAVLQLAYPFGSVAKTLLSLARSG